MSRRHIQPQGDTPVPNLIFYAPLTENDLTDHISGAVMITNDMEATIKQTHLQTIVLAAIMSLMLMAAAYFCTHFTRYTTTTTSTTLQWSSDSSWVKGGWR